MIELDLAACLWPCAVAFLGFLGYRFAREWLQDRRRTNTAADLAARAKADVAHDLSKAAVGELHALAAKVTALSNRVGPPR